MNNGDPAGGALCVLLVIALALMCGNDLEKDNISGKLCDWIERKWKGRKKKAKMGRTQTLDRVGRFVV